MNTILLVLAMMVGRAVLAGLWSVFPSIKELIAIPTAIAFLTFLIRFLPEGTRFWLKQNASTALSSSVTTLVVTFILAVEIGLGLSVANVQFAWDGPPELHVSVEGKDVLLKGTQDKESKSTSWQAYVLRFAFLPRIVRAGSYVHTIRPLPFQLNTVKIPEYLAESDASTELVETDLSYVLLQMNQKIFYERAQKRFVALKARIGPAATKRLQAISDLLDEAYLPSKEGSGKPANLFIAYKTTYPEDPWIPALDATVAMSERRYGDAAATLSQAISSRDDSSQVSPNQATLIATYAVALIRQARDLQANQITRPSASQRLLLARQAIEHELDKHHVSEIDDSEAALRWHLALVEFYSQSDDDAIQELSRLASSHAEPLLRARAKNAAGYVMLMNGRLDEADRLFSQSSSIAPDLPTPRINRGYLLLIKGKYGEAETHFRSLLIGADRLSAERDRTLAHLGLALSLDAQRNTDKSTEEYEAVLRELRGVGAVEVDNSLRPAFIRLRLAKDVFLRNRDYYALEVWGGVMLGSSCRLLCKTETNSPLFSEIKAEINQNARWVFEVLAPRSDLLQYRDGVLGGILPRSAEPCECQPRKIK